MSSIDQPRKDLFDRLAKMLDELSDEAQDNAVVNSEINSKVDLDLLKSMQNHLHTQSEARAEGPFKISTIIASLSYLLAWELYVSCPSQKDACVFSQIYGNFVHDAVHMMHERFGDPSKLEKSH